MKDDDLLPLSALQHYLYCPRQCALIQLEQVWSENLYTAEGRVLHEKVHEGGAENRRDVRIATGLRLVSHQLGLAGQADVTEFRKTEKEYDECGRKLAVHLPGSTALWLPFPVEYKRGKPKKHRADEVQLCAQAMCLEEMLKVYIAGGALFYGATRRRQAVEFTAALRALTEDTAERLHKLVENGIIPPPVYDRSKCERCSLVEICQPGSGVAQNVHRYIKNMVAEGDEKAA